MSSAVKATPDLPIRRYADDIVQAVKDNPTVVVIGETGSGKTTQISQILLQAGFAEHGLIGITQPRRVAAVTVAKRVSEELGVELGKEVGYSVRFEDCSSSKTKIKYLTDGTLLRECLDDAQLSRYSVIVLDEAHERSLNTDILFGLLKRLVRTRQPTLKLVVTSATLDGEKFSAYFDACPVFTVPGRCYPVDVVHSLEDHTHDYVDASVDTVLQLHLDQPEGDILVFLTGQAEIEKAVSKLNEGIASLPDGSCGPLLLLPLYAALPPELQVRVFRPAPPGTRRCIIATNVAETSITVDGVVYVVDSGMVKLKSYQPNTGMDSLDVVATSRVGATQRAGRAGRTRAGKCYRLYSKKFYDFTMPDVTPPEIQRTSLAGAVLHLKSLALDIDILSFEFLDPPSRESLEDALRTLYVLDALDESGHVTEVGKVMANLPLEPGLARCMLAAADLKCLPEVCSIAAMLSSEHVFEHGRGPSDGRAGGGGGGGGPGGRPVQRGPTELLKELMSEGLGDHVLLLRLWDAWASSGFNKGMLRDLGLDFRGMGFARDIRRQLEGVMAGQLQRHNQGRGGHRGHKQQQQQPGGGSDRAPEGNDSLHATGVPSASGRSCAEGGSEAVVSSSSHGRHRDRSRSKEGQRGLGHDREQRRSRDRSRQHDKHRRSRSRSRDNHGGRRRASRSRSRSPRGNRGGQAGQLQGAASGGAGASRQGVGGGSMERHVFPSEQHRLAAVVKALTMGFAHKLARRLPRHNGYRTLGTGAVVGGGQLAQLHPACSGLAEDSDGLLPEWVVYHELVSTSRPFLRQVCTTQFAFVEHILTKIAHVDVIKLSGGVKPQPVVASARDDGQAAPPSDKQRAAAPVAQKKDASTVDAARQRYLQRKQQTGKK